MMDVTLPVTGNIEFYGQMLTVKPDAVVNGKINVKAAQMIDVQGTINGEVTGSYQVLDWPNRPDVQPSGDVPATSAELYRPTVGGGLRGNSTCARTGLKMAQVRTKILRPMDFHSVCQLVYSSTCFRQQCCHPCYCFITRPGQRRSHRESSNGEKSMSDGSSNRGN